MIVKPNADTPRRSSDDRSTANRLNDALTELIRQQASSRSPDALTATALCQLAGVSRNALYRYHPEVVQALHKVQRQHRSADPGPATHHILKLRGENDVLREQVAKLAALVDHYYTAWQENRALLERRERELAQLRRDTKPTVISIRN